MVQSRRIIVVRKVISSFFSPRCSRAKLARDECVRFVCVSRLACETVHAFLSFILFAHSFSCAGEREIRVVNLYRYTCAFGVRRVTRAISLRDYRNLGCSFFHFRIMTQQFLVCVSYITRYNLALCREKSNSRSQLPEQPLTARPRQ